MAKLNKEQRRKRREKNKKLKAKRLRIRKEKQKKKLQPWAPVKMKMVQVPDFLPKDFSQEKRLELIRSIGSEAKKDFDEKYPTIIEWFNKYDPLYLLSYCSFYLLSHPEGIDPEASGSMDFYPHYLEILQAFALTQKRHISAKPLLEDGNRLEKDMREIGELMSLRLLDIPKELSSEEDLRVHRLRTEMMLNTAAVRNWAYYHQMLRVTLDLAKLVDEPFQNIYKVKASSLIKLLFDLIEKLTEDLNVHRQKVGSFLRKGNYREIIAAYNEAFPEIENIEGDDVEVVWEHAGKSKKNLSGMLLCHSDLQLEEIYSFTLDQAYSLIDDSCSKKDLGKVLDQLSYSFGELEGFEKEHIILNNPTHHRPFIKTDEDTYYSSIWGLVPHIALTLLEDFVWKDAGLKSKYVDAKSKYLEDEIERIVANAFPNGKVYKGSLWTDPVSGKTFENDLTVVIDGFAIVIEAKSGIVSDPAKRGAPDDLFETLKRLIEEPSEQALRFIDYLKNNKEEHVFKDKSGRENKIDSTQINYYIPLGVTFYHLGAIGSNLKKIIQANVVDKKLEELAPSMSFTDLEIVLDLLSLEAERVHYLARRREFEAHVEYEGDEIDLLGFYLDHGFNIGDAEYTKDHAFNITLKSKELDPYVVGSNEGRDIEKPKLAMSNWWRDLLEKISERRIEGWIETCFVLLNSTKEDQEKFETALKKLEFQIEKGKTTKPHNWVMFSTGPERRRYMIAGYPYITKDKNLRDSIMAQILDEDVSKKSRGAVIIGKNLNQNDYPYSVLARRMSTDLFDTLTLE